MSTNTQNKKNNLKVLIICLAILIVLTVAAFAVYKIVKKSNDTLESNVTLFTCNMGKTLSESDLDDIKETITAAIGDKVLNITKGQGIIPALNTLTDENGAAIDVGDSITVTFSILSTAETEDVFNALAQKYGITPLHIVGLGFSDIYRADYK